MSSSQSPLTRPSILRHVLKYAIKHQDARIAVATSELQTSLLVPTNILQILVNFTSVSSSWKDTVYNYSSGTISTSILPLKRWSFIELFQDACQYCNLFHDASQEVLRRFPNDPSPNFVTIKFISCLCFIRNDRRRNDKIRVASSVPKIVSELLLELLVKRIMLREWTEARRENPTALVKLLPKVDRTCLRLAVWYENAPLVRFIVENMSPNLDVECYPGFMPDKSSSYVVREVASTFTIPFQQERSSAEVLEILGDAYLDLERRRDRSFEKRRPRKSGKALLSAMALLSATAGDRSRRALELPRLFDKRNRRQTSIFDEPKIFFRHDSSSFSASKRPLMAACSSIPCNIELIKLLVNKFGCFPDSLSLVDNVEESPLSAVLSVFHHRRTVEVVKFLLFQREGPYSHIKIAVHFPISGRGGSGICCTDQARKFTLTAARKMTAHARFMQQSHEEIGTDLVPLFFKYDSPFQEDSLVRNFSDLIEKQLFFSISALLDRINEITAEDGQNNNNNNNNNNSQGAICYSTDFVGEWQQIHLKGTSADDKINLRRSFLPRLTKLDPEDRNTILGAAIEACDSYDVPLIKLFIEKGFLTREIIRAHQQYFLTATIGSRSRLRHQTAIQLGQRSFVAEAMLSFLVDDCGCKIEDFSDGKFNDSYLHYLIKQPQDTSVIALVKHVIAGDLIPLSAQNGRGQTVLHLIQVNRHLSSIYRKEIGGL